MGSLPSEMFLKILSDIQSGRNIEHYLCDLMAPLLTYIVTFKIMQNIEIKNLGRTKDQGKKSGF